MHLKSKMLIGEEIKRTNNKKGGEKMKAKALMILLAGILVLTCASAAMAASYPVPVSAIVPAFTLTGVTVSRITPDGADVDLLEDWNPAPGGSVNFGTLTVDAVYKIFRPQDSCYYAVDVTAIKNNGALTITHNRTSVASGGNNLDNKINVSFTASDGITDTLIGSKMSFGGSDGQSFTANSGALAGKWLRIYYGLGTGLGDAVGVVPVPLTQPIGTYSGSITITIV